MGLGFTVQGSGFKVEGFDAHTRTHTAGNAPHSPQYLIVPPQKQAEAILCQAMISKTRVNHHGYRSALYLWVIATVSKLIVAHHGKHDAGPCLGGATKSTHKFSGGCQLCSCTTFKLKISTLKFTNSGSTKAPAGKMPLICKVDFPCCLARVPNS